MFLAAWFDNGCSSYVSRGVLTKAQDFVKLDLGFFVVSLDIFRALFVAWLDSGYTLMRQSTEFGLDFKLLT